MNARHEEKRGGTVLHEVKPTRTTRNQCYGKMRSRAPSKPCLRATFLLRFLQAPSEPLDSAPETTLWGEPHGPARHHEEKACIQEVVPGLATCRWRTLHAGLHVSRGGVGLVASVAP
jgi:hypothetical protein